jgi:hypothetical protein
MQTRQLDEFAVAQRRQFEKDLNLTAAQRDQLGTLIFAWVLASFSDGSDGASIDRAWESLVEKAKVTA